MEKINSAITTGVISEKLHYEICQFAILPTGGTAKFFYIVNNYTLSAVQSHESDASAVNFARVSISTK